VKTEKEYLEIKKKRGKQKEKEKRAKNKQKQSFSNCMGKSGKKGKFLSPLPRHGTVQRINFIHTLKKIYIHIFKANMQ